MRKRRLSLTGVIDEVRSRALPSSLSSLTSLVVGAQIAEHAVLVIEGACCGDLEKGTGTHLACALFEVAKIAHDLQRNGVFRECAQERAMSDGNFCTVICCF